MVARNTKSGTRRVLLSLGLTLAVLAGAPAGAQEAGSRPGLAERFPPGTLLVVRMRDIAGYLDWMASSPFGQMVKDPEVQPVWEQFTGLVQKLNARASEKVGVDFLKMLAGIKGEVAFGLTKFQITPAGPSVGVMLALDCRDAAETFKKDVDSLLGLLPPGVFEVSDREVKGVPIRTFTPVKKTGRRRDPLRFVGAIHLAWIDSVLLISNDKSGFDRFLRVRRGDEQITTLGQTADWRDTMDKLGGAGLFTFYLNIQAISEVVEGFAGMMPGDAGPVISALGLDEFPAMASNVTLEGDVVKSRFILRYTGDGKSGLGSLLAFKKTNLSIPNWVPEDAMQVLVVNYDFSRAFSGLLGLVQEAGEEPYEDLQQGLEEFQKEHGLSLQDDVIDALSGPVVVVSYEPIAGKAGARRPGRVGMMFNPLGLQGRTLIGIRITNRKPVEQLLELAESAGAEVTEYMGATIFSFSPPGLDQDEPLAEAAITDNYVLFGLGGGSLVRQTLQRMGGREAGYGGLQGVREAITDLPREGIALVVTNYGRNLASSVNLIKVVARLARTSPEILARFPIPSSSILEKYLGYGAGVFFFEPGTGFIADSRWRLKRP